MKLFFKGIVFVLLIVAILGGVAAAIQYDPNWGYLAGVAFFLLLLIF